jgi:hypothetical protein
MHKEACSCLMHSNGSNAITWHAAQLVAYVLRFHLGDMHACRLGTALSGFPIASMHDVWVWSDTGFHRLIAFADQRRLHSTSPDVIKAASRAANPSSPFSFSLALQTRHRRILLRACIIYCASCLPSPPLSRSSLVWLFVSANHSRNVGMFPSLESTETCGLAFQRHVCDTNAHPAWTLTTIHAHDTRALCAFLRCSNSVSVCLFLMVVKRESS